MRLPALIRRVAPELDVFAPPDLEITAVREDSRQVRPGELFVARMGHSSDGAGYVADAVARGAAAVVCDRHLPDCPVPLIVLPQIREALGRLAHELHDRPSHRLKLIGVTGTNGKTTTAWLIRHLLNASGRRCGMIGTVQTDDGARSVESSMTTPSAVDLAETLARMVANGCDSCAMEASSHALKQGRVSALRFAAAGFSNLTGDHLDYHGTMDDYAASKALLFAGLPPGAVAVVNIDDPASLRMVRDTAVRVVRFGIDAPADYRAVDLALTANGARFALLTPYGPRDVATGLIGRHNVANALLSLALAVEGAGLPIDQGIEALGAATAPPGRLQPVLAGQPFGVLVDYAHTDDALANVLRALRPLCRGRLRVLFGCGGDRDPTKRPRMAQVAEQLADDVYLTSDNPRTENPQSIIDAVFAGFSADKRAAVRVSCDRREAIGLIIHEAREGDVVLLAGKGHENYQIVGRQKHHFDDCEEATQAIRRAIGRAA